MIIIETPHQFDSFCNELNSHPSIIFPMWLDHQIHQIRSNLSFLFIRCNGVDYVLSINHTDCVNQSYDRVKQILEQSIQRKIVFNLKSMLFRFDLLNSVDADSLIFLSRREFTGSYKFDWKNEFMPIFSFYNSMGYSKNIIQSLPILKLCDIIKNIIVQLNPKFEITDDIKWYSSVYIPTLSKIESYGLIVNRIDYIRNVGKFIHLTNDNKVYTEYNPYTVTGRPSNRHGGVNYSALNKNTGIRDSFIAGDGNFLIQFDYDSYHLRLIGNLIDMELPNESVHQWFADQYKSTYEESKAITFRQIYGGIEREFLNIPFFKKTQEFIDNLWVTTNDMGYIKTLHRKIPLNWVHNADKNKVFNYLLQAIETEINIDKLSKIMNIIQNTNIELILYTYDSFIFRVPIDSNLTMFGDILNILKDGNYPVKRKIGYTFGEL